MRRPSKQRIAVIGRKYGLEFLAVFGSRATAEAGKGSDIDLAVLFGRVVSPREELELFYELVSLFETDRLDLVVLDGANPLLLKEVALHGEPLFERRGAAFDKFIMRALAKYQDTRAYRSLGEELVRERLKEKRREETRREAV